MILVENGLGLLQIEIVDGALAPGKGEHPVQVIPDDRGLGRLGMHLGQPADILLDFPPDFFRHLELFQLFLKAPDLFLKLVALAQLLLDGLHLLAEEILALMLVHFALGLGRDPRLDVEDLDLLGQVIVDFFEAGDRIDDFEDRLGFGDLELEVGPGQVGQPAGLLHVRGDD